MTKTVTITPNLKDIQAQLEKIINNPKARQRVLTQGVLELKDRAAAYPPEGPWNKAPGVNGNNIWYQRQFGRRWLKKNGTLGGLDTSQRLQKSWQVEVQRGDAFSAAAYTQVTYAPLLLDPEKQVNWAPGHGWQTVDEIAEGYAPRFVALVLAEIDREIDTP